MHVVEADRVDRLDRKRRRLAALATGRRDLERKRQLQARVTDADRAVGDAPPQQGRELGGHADLGERQPRRLADRHLFERDAGPGPELRADFGDVNGLSQPGRRLLFERDPNAVIRQEPVEQSGGDERECQDAAQGPEQNATDHRTESTTVISGPALRGGVTCRSYPTSICISAL